MLVACFSTKPYDRQFLEAASTGGDLEWRWLEPRLTPETVRLAEAAEAVCCFVNDRIDAAVVAELSRQRVRLIALRCAGYNQVDLAATAAAAIPVVRVPEYSPHAVAEHTIGLTLMLDRRLHKSYNRVREGNFSLDGLLGFDLHGRTVGVIGTGRIGSCVARILLGFGCRILAHDLAPIPELVNAGVCYTNVMTLLSEADIVTLHCPLTPATQHLIDTAAVARMRRGALLINTSRGGLIDTRAVISGLNSGHLGGLAIDVYEEEADLFFEDKSNDIIADDIFVRLLTFPNVVVTAHQAFFTRDAMEAIARQTVDNLTRLGHGEPLQHIVVRP